MTFAASAGVWASSILAGSSRKESTKSRYAMLTRVHLTPAPFGTLSLAAIKPRQIDQLIMRLQRPV